MRSLVLRATHLGQAVKNSNNSTKTRAKRMGHVLQIYCSTWPTVLYNTYIANIKRVIKYGIFSRVFLSLFLLKYQRILMSWYFKRNKVRNTSENVPYLITSFIFNLLIITTNALFCEQLNISVKYWSRGGAIYLHWKRIFNYRSNQ